MNPASPEALEVLTTTEGQQQALDMARELIDQRLAACVQVVGPVTSVYRWQGRVETSEEWQCRAKTAADRYDELAAAIRRLHDYDEPEIIALPITAGSRSYVQWLIDETR